MRNWIVNIVLLIAVLASVLLYSYKFSIPDWKADMIVSLGDVHTFFKPDESIQLKNCVPIPESYAPKNSMFPEFVHYALAPVRVDSIDAGKVMLLFPLGVADSIVAREVDRKEVIWETSDDAYRYILVQKM